jgi:hypothetical protein
MNPPSIFQNEKLESTFLSLILPTWHMVYLSYLGFFIIIIPIVCVPGFTKDIVISNQFSQPSIPVGMCAYVHLTF